MIAIDTNILVRYLIEPDSAHGRTATQVLETALTPARPGYVTAPTLAELIWVLEKHYSVPPAVVRNTVATLIGRTQLVFEHYDAVERALQSSHRGLADMLLHEIGRAAGCTTTLTFDKRFARVDGVELAA